MVSSRAENITPDAEGRIRPASLSKNQRAQLDQEIAARLQEAGLQPYQQSALERHAAEPRPYSPDLSRRWVFPTIGLTRALHTAHTLVTASRGNDLSALRLVTLRLGRLKNESEALGDHLTRLSGAINKCVPYLAQLKLIAPILSIPHIRLEKNGNLDVHLHALWRVDFDEIGAVRARLQTHFPGGVWIDESTVHSLWRAAFYMASGVLDYPTIPQWPLEILQEVWGLDHRRMIRPAGWYASYIKASNADASDRRQEARQRRLDGALQPSEGQRSERHQAPTQDATGVGGLMMGGYPGAKAPSVQTTQNGDPISPSYTVRSVVPEPSHFDPSLAPTVDELWIALHVLEARMVEPIGETFEQICSRLSLSPEVADRSICRVEQHLRSSLFFPGGDRIPTTQGRDFVRAGRPILQDLDMLAVSLGREAVWAGTPGRIEFEKRIGMGPPADDLNI